MVPCTILHIYYYPNFKHVLILYIKKTFRMQILRYNVESN